jgi:Tol biopolymer transport system component
MQLTSVKGGACDPDWPPDGAKIVFTGFDGKNSDGGNVTHISPGYAAHWSPDESKLVFIGWAGKGNSQEYPSRLPLRTVMRRKWQFAEI